MVISSTERRSCLEEKHNRRRRRGRRKQGEGKDEEEKDIPMSARKASVSCHLLLNQPPSLPPSFRTLSQPGGERRTEGGHKLSKSEFNRQERESMSPESLIFWGFLPLKPASAFLMRQCVCVLRLLVSRDCKYEYTNVRTNQCEHECVIFHLQPAYGVK